MPPCFSPITEEETPAPFPLWFPDLISSLHPSPGLACSFLRYSSSYSILLFSQSKQDTHTRQPLYLLSSRARSLSPSPWTSRGPGFLATCPLHLVSGICTCGPPWSICHRAKPVALSQSLTSLTPWQPVTCQSCPLWTVYSLSAIWQHSLGCFVLFFYQGSIFGLFRFLCILLMVSSSTPAAFTLISVQEPTKLRSLSVMSSLSS